MDHARDTGEMCGPPLASNEEEGTVALSGTAATSLFVVENSLEIRSPNLGFAVNNQKSQSAVPHNTHKGAST
jgi:hypothetical protein